MNHFPRLLTAFTAGLAFVACDATDTPADFDSDLETTSAATVAFDGASIELASLDIISNPIPCLRDYAEPDDRLEMAVAAEFDSPLARSACENDVDFFVMDLEAGQAADVVARFNRAEGDIEVVVSAPDGKFMGASEIRSDRAEVSFVAEEAGEHRIVVVLTGDRGGADGTTYHMRVRDPLAECSADVLEPNNGLDSSSDLLGEAVEQTACEADEDWFHFEASEGDRVRVTVDSESADGDVDFAVYAPDGSFAGGVFGNDELASYDEVAAQSGQYRVLVYLAEGSQAGVAYDVFLTVDGGGADGQQ
ncbi:MAG: hypothetical protein GY898_34125 [Proteobacteria bacterium]|nr:hypothetical protein [Pseudomonadota bacterium]